MLRKIEEEKTRISEEELSILVQKYSKLLYVVAVSILGKTAKKEDVEEVISDVFLRYWQNMQEYDPQRGSLKNYFVLLTKSMCLNQLRKSKRMFSPLADFPIEELQQEALEISTIWDTFFEALSTLKEPTREICLERYFYELKPKIIAKNLDIPIKEVKNRLYQGKKKIRKEMEYLLLEEGV